MVDREEDVDQDAQNCKLCGVTANSKYRKTSNKPGVQYNLGVHLVPTVTYDISSLLSGKIMTKSLGYTIE